MESEGQPLFTRARQFLLSDFGVKVEEKIQQVPAFEKQNFFVAYDDILAESNKICAWPLEDCIKYLNSSDPTILQTRGDDKGNGKQTFKISPPVEKLAQEMRELYLVPECFIFLQ